MKPPRRDARPWRLVFTLVYLVLAQMSSLEETPAAGTEEVVVNKNKRFRKEKRMSFGSSSSIAFV